MSQLFPAEIVLSATQALVPVPGRAHTSTVRYSEKSILDGVRRLLTPGEVADSDRVDDLVEFITRLPSAEEQTKIITRLTELAQGHGAHITDFRWWNIMRGENWLFATVRRSDVDILVSFSWKMVKRGGTSGMTIIQEDGSWARDTSAPHGWRYEFFHTEYHTLVAHFEAWLKAEIKPLPWATDSRSIRPPR